MSAKEFDSLLGGEEVLPPSVAVGKFIRSRINEVNALTESIESPLREGMFYQRLPKHLRRRSLAHALRNRRVPSRFHGAYKAVLEQKKSSKRIRYTFKRLKRTLIDKYNRRQKKFTWLRTHIWHAKRFHMKKVWGYHLAEKPSDKAYRACYRATAQHALVQDISYLVCIELRGVVEDLFAGLAHHSNIECGLTFKAKYYLDGSREGQLMFYKKDQYPRGAIGEVTFIWRPDVLSERALWIWSHPAFYKEVLEELVATFDLQLSPREETTPEEAGGAKTGTLRTKLKTKVMAKEAPVYKSIASSVELTLLKDSLARFRLTGPKSNAVLKKAFRIADVTVASCPWVKGYYYSIDRQQSFFYQTVAWTTICKTPSPSQLPPKCILPLVIIDPKLTMPSSKMEELTCTTEPMENIATLGPLDLIDSPIWSEEKRQLVTEGAISFSELNKRRQKKLVPGLKWEEPSEKTPCLPILLVHQPGSQSKDKRLGFGSGWDIISPLGYEMALWLCLVHHGGRAGGLRETFSTIRETGKLGLFPPDTAAGVSDEKEKAEQYSEEYFRRAPSKRPNFIKFGIPRPFEMPWGDLLREISGEEEAPQFYVLRSRAKLNQLREGLLSKSTQLDSFSSDELRSCLVGVNVVSSAKGDVYPNERLYFPNKEDTSLLQSHSLFEPGHKDPKRNQRLALRKEHQKELKKLRRKRVELKRQSKPVDEFRSTEAVQAYNKEIKDLWLPDSDSVLRGVPCRPVVGFVTEGAFCFSESCSAGQGYVTLHDLLNLIKSYKDGTFREPFLLIREHDSTYYKAVTIKVVTC